MFDLSGKVALVTGAGQNAGAGIAIGLARQGATVIANDLFEERARSTVDAIEAAGGRAVAQLFDVTDISAAEDGIRAGEALLGGTVDILVNNAGNGGAEGSVKIMRFADMPPELWRAPIDVNLFGVMTCVHLTLRNQIEKGWGRIITIASAAGTMGLDIGLSHYGAGKGGAIAFMRHIAVENGPYGITANSVSLGLIKQGDIPILNERALAIPTRQRGTPDDVAALCIYLASPEARWLTGQTIRLNGGSETS
jgi:NAD(P)-dependent dehydrogenase (short-subunit alcohol dehydrogenase family)